MIRVKFECEQREWATIKLPGVPREDELVFMDDGIDYRVSRVWWDVFDADYDVRIILA